MGRELRQCAHLLRFVLKVMDMVMDKVMPFFFLLLLPVVCEQLELK